jgi:hypothetical protein
MGAARGIPAVAEEGLSALIEDLSPRMPQPRAAMRHMSRRLTQSAIVPVPQSA